MDPDHFIHLFGQTDIGNQRQTNEDAWWAGQLGGSFASTEILGETLRLRCTVAPVLAVVCDGVGGANAGEVASQMAVSCIPAFLGSRQTALSIAGSAGDTLRASLQAADAAIKTKATLPGMSGMCTTVSLLCLVGTGFAWWGQAGDSRIYRYRRGQLKQITRDHSPVGRMRQDGVITEEAARRHPQRNQIDQSLGDQLNPFAPDVGSVNFQPLDVYLLCSDGLSDGLWDGEIAQIMDRVRSGADVRPAAEHLIAAAKQTSGRDNITAVVVFVEAPAAKP